jgi:hypothetical protein
MLAILLSIRTRKTALFDQYSPLSRSRRFSGGCVVARKKTKRLCDTEFRRRILIFREDLFLGADSHIKQPTLTPPKDVTMASLRYPSSAPWTYHGFVAFMIRLKSVLPLSRSGLLLL